jgi:hypothetical protein
MDTDERLRQIEARLARLEQFLSDQSSDLEGAAETPLATNTSGVNAVSQTPISSTAPPPEALPVAAAANPPPPFSEESHRLAKTATQRHQRPLDITTVLGLSGAIALVLSAAYLVQLFIESGWLTPQRQILTATLAGFLLIGGGLLLRQRDRRYAALLPAAGVVILFLSSYAAYLLYSLLEPRQLVAIVSASCLISLALERCFASPLYSLFAVAGAYATPFLIQQVPQPYSLQQTLPLSLLAFYYLAWNLLFSLHSLLSRQRRPYLLAFYLSALGFALISQPYQTSQWAALASIQASLWLIFVGTTVVFSLGYRQPLTVQAAWLHFLGLVLFYVLEWDLLFQQLPDLTPWLGLASALLLQVVIYGLARRLGSLAAGSTLVHGYTSLVLLHAGYWHLLPATWRPWFALALGTSLLSRRLRHTWHPSRWPYGLLGAYILGAAYLQTALLTTTTGWNSENVQSLLFAALAYGGFWKVKQLELPRWLSGLLLYGGHAAFAVATGRIGSPIWLAVAVAWAGLALGCLFLGRRDNDRSVAVSGLVMLAASALLAYVAFFSRLVIDPANPSLGLTPLLLGGVYAGCLYAAGGWLMRQMRVPPLLRLTILLLAHLVLLLSLLNLGNNPLASALSWSLVAALVWAMGSILKDDLLLQSFWFVFSLAVFRGFAGFFEALSQREHYWMSDGLWGLAYAACSYGIAFLCRRSVYPILPLYSGHVAFLAATLILLKQSIWVSASWAVWAIALLLLALRTRQPRLGQSSLLIFALSAFKVLAYDLRDGDPLVRVGVLALLGISLYAGGWLYRQLNNDSAAGKM